MGVTQTLVRNVRQAYVMDIHFNY